MWQRKSLWRLFFIFAKHFIYILFSFFLSILSPFVWVGYDISTSLWLWPLPSLQLLCHWSDPPITTSPNPMHYHCPNLLKFYFKLVSAVTFHNLSILPSIWPPVIPSPNTAFSSWNHNPMQYGTRYTEYAPTISHPILPPSPTTSVTLCFFPPPYAHLPAFPSSWFLHFLFIFPLSPQPCPNHTYPSLQLYLSSLLYLSKHN